MEVPNALLCCLLSAAESYHYKTKITEEEMMKPEWYQLAEVELVYTKVKPSERPKGSTVEDAYKILQQVWDADKIDW